MRHEPAFMSAGGAQVITPDGSHEIPPELWAAYSAIVMLEPEPALLATWVRELEDGLGVTDELRAKLARRVENRVLRPWYFLRVSPNKERRVRDALGPKTEENPHGAGLTVYLPQERYRPKSTWKSRTRPLVPGILLADLPTDEALDLAREHYAVIEVLSRAGRPVTIPALHVGSLILAEACGAFDTTWGAPPPRKDKSRGRRPTRRQWEKGEFARVVEGPFEHFLAQIVAADRADRIEVVVEIFGRATSVMLDEEMLEAVA